MDMLSYFLGRLAEGGTGGSGGITYTNIVYNTDNTITLTDTNGAVHTMSCTYEDGKLIGATYDGKAVDLTYNGDALIKVGKTSVDVANIPVNIVTLDHTVTFTVDGEPYEVVSVKDGNEVQIPTEPQKSGLVFIRWENNGNEVAFPFVPTEDTEIIAYFSTRSNTNALYTLFKIDKTLYPYVVLGCYQYNESKARCEVCFCDAFRDVNGRVVSPVGHKVYFTSTFEVTADINNQNDIVSAIIEVSPSISSYTPSSDYKYMNANNSIYYTNYKNNTFSFIPEYLT